MTEKDFDWIRGGSLIPLSTYISEYNITQIKDLAGLKVYLSPKSRFYYYDELDESNPINVMGVIKNEDTYDYELPIQVYWDNGRKNSYNKFDLDIYVEDNNINENNDFGWIDDMGTYLKLKDVFKYGVLEPGDRIILSGFLFNGSGQKSKYINNFEFTVHSLKEGGKLDDVQVYLSEKDPKKINVILKLLPFISDKNQIFNLIDNDAELDVIDIIKKTQIV